MPLVRDLIALVQRHYELNGCPYARVFPYQVKPLLGELGDRAAGRISWNDVEAYKAARLAAGAARGTVNRELSALRRGYGLGRKAGFLRSAGPAIEFLRPGRPRSGFCYLEDFRRLCGHLRGVILDLAGFAYWTGWRRGEILALEWRRARGGWVWCFGKNGDEKRAPIEGHLAAVIAKRQAAREGEYVFHRAGQPVRSFRRAWISACEKAGLEGLVFHDLRRSFIRNCIRSGVDRDTAKKLSGHKTDAIFTRYNIQDERDLEEAARRLFLLKGAEEL